MRRRESFAAFRYMIYQLVSQQADTPELELHKHRIRPPRYFSFLYQNSSQ